MRAISGRAFFYGSTHWGLPSFDVAVLSVALTGVRCLVPRTTSTAHPHDVEPQVQWNTPEPLSVKP